MTLPDIFRKYPAECLLCGILILSAFLNIWNIWTGGISNAYYAAAVKSALVNPVAGFFNSLDPAGFITVDKPPVGLWVQALFAAVLGFSGWALILPQALAGVGSVALIYVIVSRPFGKPAGLVAALALAVTPISVAIARNGTMDMQMIFVILLAVWAALKAARERSLPWLLASVVLVGIGFNIKMIQAFIVVPAILAVYLLGAKDLGWMKRLLHIGLAIAILLAVSLSWSLVVDSIPADQRPFIGGSDDNTMLGLIINYNGAHRLGISTTGGGGGSGGSFGSSGGEPPTGGSGTSTITAPGSGTGSSAAGPGNGQAPSGNSSVSPSGVPGDMTSSNQTRQSSPGMQQSGSSGSPGGSPGGGSGGMGGGPGSGNSSQGFFRMFQSDLAGDISWLLMFALIGVLAWIRRPRTLSVSGIKDAGYLSEKGLTLLAMLLWLIPGLLYFSFTSGFWHDYYIATIAPPLAALVGIGAIGMYHEYVSGSRAGWLLVIAILVTGLIEADFLFGDAGFAGALVPLIVAGTLAGAGLLAFMKLRKTELLEKHRWHIIVIAVAILFIAPLAWSYTLVPVGNSGNLPTAALSGSRGGMGGGGPSSSMSGSGTTAFSGTAMSDGPQQQAMAGNSTRFSDRSGTGEHVMGAGTSGIAATGRGGPGNQTSGGSAIGGGPGGASGIGGSASTSSLAEYLISHTTNETWILAVPSSHEGADLIIQTGKPVMCLGGFAGMDQVVNVTTFRDYVHNGRVRYVMGSSSSSNSGIFSWVSANCTAVSSSESGNSGSSLYDCRGAV